MPNGTFVESKIKEQYALGADSGTVTIDLPNANYLQGLLLRVENTNGSTSNGGTAAGETIQGCITKIEVLADGITVFSATGRECRKWAHFDMGDEPPMDETQVGSAVQWAMFPILFGAYRNDTDFILPAFAMSSLQLLVTWAFTDSTTAGWTTSESSAKMDVIARYLYSPERTLTPCMKHKEIYTKTPAATGEESVVLPVGAGNGFYRRIMVYCYETAIEDATDTDKIQLLLNDAQTLVNTRWTTLQAKNAVDYNAKHTKAVAVMLSDTDTYATHMSRITGAGAASSVKTSIAAVTAVAGDRITVGLGDTAGAAISADEAIRLNIRGAGVSHAVMLDLVDAPIPVGPGSDVSSLKLLYNVAATGGDTRVVVEQIIQFAQS